MLLRSLFISNILWLSFALQIPLHSVSVEKPTIYQTLAGDEKFSRLAKAIQRSDKVLSILNDSSASVTFFAVPNSALPNPHKGKDPAGDFQILEDDAATSFLWEDEDDGCDTLDDKKKRLQKIITAILEYHILPQSLKSSQLVEKVTVPTRLSFDGTLDGQPLRLRVVQSLVPPTVLLNFKSKVVTPNIEASNGIIHIVDNVIFPRLSIFQQLFMDPGYFSTLSSVIQRTGLTDALDLRYVQGSDGRFEGTPIVTLFAPTNQAFEALPEKLQQFLFSPWGGSALQKLLQYHIVPGVVLHSDYIHNATTNEDEFRNSDALAGPACPSFLGLPPSKPIFDKHLRADTLLENRALHVNITRFKIPSPIPGQTYISTKVYVENHLVTLPDLVAMNGAIHVIDKLLVPHKRHRDDDQFSRSLPSHASESLVKAGLKLFNKEETLTWEKWEEWLPAWAGV